MGAGVRGFLGVARGCDGVAMGLLGVARVARGCEGC